MAPITRAPTLIAAAFAVDEEAGGAGDLIQAGGVRRCGSPSGHE
jgi:hypothetical protein